VHCGRKEISLHSPIVSAEWNEFVKNPYSSSLIDFEEPYEGREMQAYRIWLSLFEVYIGFELPEVSKPLM
jgi:hypothetical protein